MPGIFWLWYFYNKDKQAPEPKRLIVRTFFLGMLSTVPAGFFASFFSGTGAFSSVVAAPIIEEYVKYFVVARWAYSHAEFDEPMDGIVYAAAAALGFASLENVGYLFVSYLDPENAGDPSSAVLTVFALRALLSVPGHVLDSSMWGYALGMAKFSDKETGRKMIRNGLLLAMLLHGTFNFLATIGTLVSGGALVIFYLGCWWLIRRRIASALVNSPGLDGAVSPSLTETDRPPEKLP